MSDASIFDLLIVGGGINGVGNRPRRGWARVEDAAGRARYAGAQNSSASSKLIHGGLRYLEQGASGWYANRCASASD